MVFFSCDGCGEMLKKNQVDGHANRCRRCKSVSCVDCSVSFWGDEYRAHTSCISEAERYEGKASSNNSKKTIKKRTPQQEWMDVVATVASNNAASPTLKSHLQVMAGLDNIPRKEKQFINFTSNSLKLRSANGSNTIVQEIWKVLKQEQERRTNERKQQELQKQEHQQHQQLQQTLVDGDKSRNNQCVDNQVEEVLSKDNKESESEERKTMKEQASIDAKKVHKAMKKVLKKAPNHSMKINSLRKLILKQLGLPETSKKQLRKVLISYDKANIDGKVISLAVRR